MNTDQHLAALDSLTSLLRTADDIRAELQQLRANVPDSVWDQQTEGPFGTLLDHCLELESHLED